MKKSREESTDFSPWFSFCKAIGRCGNEEGNIETKQGKAKVQEHLTKIRSAQFPNKIALESSLCAIFTFSEILCSIDELPYSGEIFEGENFHEFRDFSAIRESFLHEILGMPHPLCDQS